MSQLDEQVPEMKHLTSFMQKAMLDRAFSYEDYQNYAPLIDELVYYVSVCFENKEMEGPFTVQQALTLARFGNNF